MQDPFLLLRIKAQWDTHRSKRGMFELRDIGWSYRKIHQKYPDIPLSTSHYTIKQHNQQSISDPSYKEMEAICERPGIMPENADKRRKWVETHVTMFFINKFIRPVTYEVWGAAR